MIDAFDLSVAAVERSPADIASWPVTVGITRVQEDPVRGFTLTFDQVIPESWKWPSNPQVPSDNFQFTVWAFIQRGGAWVGAGFVQMWQGRSMTDESLPAIFMKNVGVPGYTNWWGDTRKLWPTMADYVPEPGDQIGLMVSAGNARLISGVTSVRERSQVVVVELPEDDRLDVQVGGTTPVPTPGDLASVLAALDQLRVQVSALQRTADGLSQQLDKMQHYVGAVKLPSWLGGSAPITLDVKP